MLSLALGTSGVLGFLAFFEPCTIATHTLFSARNTRGERGRCCRNLFAVWLARGLLLSLLFLLAVMLIEAPAWTPLAISIGLSLIASVYLISRFVYLPIPHFSLAGLLPGGHRLPYAVKLGLTLPACTLPLVLITAALLVSVGSLPVALAAAWLFASLFTLPMAVASFTGIGPDAREFLSRIAAITPWITAALLFGAAAWPWLGALDLSAEPLARRLGEAGSVGLGLAFLTGLFFSFNPVSFAAIPVMLAYVTRADRPARARQMGAAFIFGLVLTHVALGVTASLGGGWVKGIMGRQWGLLLGPLLILLGLMWAGWMKIRMPWFGFRGRRASGLWGAFLLGIPFSIAVCPFCTPALLVTLTASAAIGSAGYGALLLLAFALGRSLPILAGAWSMSWLESLRGFSRHQRGIEILSGVVLILSGLYLLNEYFFIIPTGM